MPSRPYLKIAATLFVSTLSGLSPTLAAPQDQDAKVRQVIDDAIKPLLKQYAIPGMAVGVTIDGKRTFVEYGDASINPKVAVTRDTLFELGSISKTFTSTLAAYAEVEGKLSLKERVSAVMPALKGSALDHVRVLDLATHTAGGFPLQLPGDVKTEKQLIAYFKSWKPQYTPGTHRVYANPSVGLLGMVTAKAMGAPFQTLAERLFAEIGLKRTYIAVPAAEMKSYAWGYSRDNKPSRVSPALLAIEAYGVKSNAVDMLRYLEANMGVGAVPPKVARALEATHTGYFRAGELIQDLIWEQYPWPVTPEKLAAGNTVQMGRANSHPATAIDPPMAPRGDVLVNKTGSTNGFGAYVAFVPEKKIGIVMLANRIYPNDVRAKAALQVLSRLTQ
nr:class C beta-lactamase [Pseudorhodoplanes sinuspersici]